MVDMENIICTDFTNAAKFLSDASSDGFKVAHFNIRSLRKHWNQFCVMTSSSLPTFDAFVLSESNILSEHFFTVRPAGLPLSFRTHAQQKKEEALPFL